jgi:hypothetical protein
LLGSLIVTSTFWFHRFLKFEIIIFVPPTFIGLGELVTDRRNRSTV